MGYNSDRGGEDHLKSRSAGGEDMYFSFLGGYVYVDFFSWRIRLCTFLPLTA